jgi:hypothetical protein
MSLLPSSCGTYKTGFFTDSEDVRVIIFGIAILCQQIKTISMNKYLI